jgi:hypothetical protein
MTATTRRLRAYQIEYATLFNDEPRVTELAEFTLSPGGRVTVTWHSHGWFKDLIEHHGIVKAAPNRVLHPKDGVDFFDALPLAFSQSTCVQIEEVTTPPQQDAQQKASPIPRPRPSSKRTPTSKRAAGRTAGRRARR